MIAIEHRHRQQQCPAAHAERGLPHLERLAQRSRADTDEKNLVRWQPLRRAFDHGNARRRFEVRILTGCAADADAVDARPHQHVDKPIEGCLVEPAIVADRCRHRGKQSLYRQMCHVEPSVSCSN